MINIKIQNRSIKIQYAGLQNINHLILLLAHNDRTQAIELSDLKSIKADTRGFPFTLLQSTAKYCIKEENENKGMLNQLNKEPLRLWGDNSQLVSKKMEGDYSNVTITFFLKINISNNEYFGD